MSKSIKINNYIKYESLWYLIIQKFDSLPDKMELFDMKLISYEEFSQACSFIKNNYYGLCLSTEICDLIINDSKEHRLKFYFDNYPNEESESFHYNFAELFYNIEKDKFECFNPPLISYKEN